jgi:hypothetical protein
MLSCGLRVAVCRSVRIFSTSLRNRTDGNEMQEDLRRKATEGDELGLARAA